MLGKLRNPSEVYNFENPRTVRYSIETLRSLGPKIWNILPNDIKSSPNLITFKIKIKPWTPVICPCNLCKPYLSGLVFFYNLYFMMFIALNKPANMHGL